MVYLVDSANCTFASKRWNQIDASQVLQQKLCEKFSFLLDSKPLELCLFPGQALVVMFLLQVSLEENCFTGF